MDYLIRSFKFGLRILVKSPAFTLIAVVALALGIGSVTTMFSVINGAIIRGLPFEEQEELMFVKRWDQERQPWNTGIPILDIQDIQREQKSFESLAAWFGGTVNVSLDNNPIRFTGSRISHNWLEILGVEPLIGRGFTAEEDKPGAAPVILLSYAVWQTHYSGDPSIVGKSASVNGALGTIIGVMPKKFQFPGRDEVWIALNPQIDWADVDRGDLSMSVMGRLKDGVSREQATAELTSFINRFAKEYPETHGEFVAASVDPVATELLGEQPIRMMWIMLAMGGFVLLIACANVANLLLARSTLRSKELAIRSSLGATRISIIGQLLVESILLSALGAFAGMLLALWATNTLQSYGEVMQLPFWITFNLDWRVLTIVTIVTLLSGLISGIVPALKASRVSVTDILKDDTRTGSSLRMGLFSKGLVVVQVAISSVLLILTVLMVRSVQNISNTDLHFDTEKVFTARMGLFDSAYPDPEDRYQFFTTLKRNLEARPEIQHTALYGRYRWTLIGVDWTRIKADGAEYEQPEDMPVVTTEYISPEYFETLGVELIEGREFTELDTPDNMPVAVINQALAEHLFPGENPIGKRITREPWPGERANMTPEEIDSIPWLTVVGVAPNMAAQGVGNTTGAEGRHFWRPMAPEYTATFMTIAARGPGNPMLLREIVRNEVIKLDPTLPIYADATPAKIVEEDTVTQRIIANIFKIFGLVAVFLASVGIYGIMSFSVNQRTMEFGIRSALGATGNSLLVLVMRSGLIQFTVGLVLGLTGAFFFSKLMQNFLFGVSPQDPVNYLLVAVVFTVVAVSACLMPARRAARVDPGQALRYE
ncbi:ABC transporter permease [Puniceicoccales bacterium CK1056]|uniref:ABC transporter permease n=1 Tax=Oceanipulchritudo coccoides TaxID=2706888 RepID=A0A6B2M2F9_9BACT|nr:ABC transporter permease [Oceanipulchritudo coccoides]NDV61985.1 ABC transporter permease [Oceanipulchritudo coccoides]